jgi:hypothetical protein
VRGILFPCLVSLAIAGCGLQTWTFDNGSCMGTSDCPTGSHCDPIAGLCVECLSMADCSGAKPRCSAALHQCVECGTSHDCLPGFECDSALYQCVPSCNDAAGCSTTPPPVCTDPSTCSEAGAACEGGNCSTGLPDAETESGGADGPVADTGSDTGAGPGPEAGLDSGLEAGRDGGPDARPDAPLDAGPDVRADAPPDAAACGGPCPAITPVCNVAVNRCVVCLSDNDCPVSHTNCDPILFTCVPED